MTTPTVPRRHRLPLLPRENDPATPGGAYRADLHRALSDWHREYSLGVRTLDARPCLTVARITSGQSLTVNTLTTVQFNSTVFDTHGWWNASTYAYTPKEPGFYRCSWSIDFHDTAAIAASTYGYAQLNVGSGTPYRFLQYGNGSALDIMVTGAAVVECPDGATALSVSALIDAGTAPTIFEETAYRSWFSVDYIGRRFVAT